VPYRRERVLRRPPLQLDPVNLHEIQRYLKNRIGQFAVAGHQNQACGGVIEPSHREKAARLAAQQVTQRGSALGIGHRRNHILRLVQYEIARLARLLGQTPGGFHPIFLGIGFGAQFGDHNTVDTDLAAANQLLSMAPRGNSRSRDDFLQTFECDGFS
jgi:hypothetical protein